MDPNEKNYGHENTSFSTGTGPFIVFRAFFQMSSVL